MLLGVTRRCRNDFNKPPPLAHQACIRVLNPLLQACIRVLYQLMSEYVSVPWQALSHLSGSVIYGGRVTDKWDQRTLSAILCKFFGESVLQSNNRSFSTIEVLHPWYRRHLTLCLGRRATFAQGNFVTKLHPHFLLSNNTLQNCLEAPDSTFILSAV